MNTLTFQNMHLFDNEISRHLPAGSVITKLYTKESSGSLCLIIEHTVTDEYAATHDLCYKDRILSIRLVKSENDKGLPINSYANTGGGTNA